MYKSTKLPVYTATIPEFESKKRAAMLDVAKATVVAAKNDLSDLTEQIASFEKFRMNKDTSVGDLQMRFPKIAKEVEAEIKHHKWAESM